MIQRSIEIDPEKCAQVAQILGTDCDRDTIDRAFDRLLSRGAENRGLDDGFLTSVTSGRYADVFDERVTTTSWW
ncbi:MAG TPA: hypothetical protein H9881_14125 [Candidatus Stackebrandtia excrementipullorum]|nr:hypothetical protein [Candidatus Stackebrandtia excrementipullorum]